METVDISKLDFGSINFTPDWAKKDAGVSVGKVEKRSEERKSFPKAMSGDRPQGERKRPPRKDFSRKPRFQERIAPLDADIKILPETKALGTVIRKLQQDPQAYKLKDLAYFFLDNPQSVLLKIVPKGEIKFYQCKACGFVSTSLDEVSSHILTQHLTDYYESKEVECEPPKGNFNCVAKCGLSGVWLGPPNIHEFNATVREMLRTRYPEMSESDYRSRIEMVRDSESIEAWRNSATKKTVFLAKGVENPPELSRDQAEGEFKRMILDSLIDSPKHLMITAEVALNCPEKSLVYAVKDALEAARKIPFDMCYALRGAFHHRKLNFFRANDNRGPEFVTSSVLKEFDASHAIPELAKVAQFILDNPCSPKVDIVTDTETEKQLAWLVSTGHVVAFTNGVYSAVEKYPKYGPQWQKRAHKDAEVEVSKDKEVNSDEDSAKLD